MRDGLKGLSSAFQTLLSIWITCGSDWNADSDWVGLSGIWDSSFLTSSQKMEMLLVHRPRSLGLCPAPTTHHAEVRCLHIVCWIDPRLLSQGAHFKRKKNLPTFFVGDRDYSVSCFKMIYKAQIDIVFGFHYFLFLHKHVLGKLGEKNIRNN